VGKILALTKLTKMADSGFATMVTAAAKLAQEAAARRAAAQARSEGGSGPEGLDVSNG